MMWTPRKRTDFGQLAAIQTGSGPMAVLLHGVGLSADAWNGQIDALSERYHVVAPDMPGHGQSAPLAGAVRLASYVDRITEAIAESAAEPVLLCGHSMGAMIALELAIRFPNVVRGVAAFNAIFQRTPQALEVVRQRARSLDAHHAPDPASTLQRWFGDAPSAERQACSGWLLEVDPASYKTAYTVFATEDGPCKTDLAALKCPALFMTGANEPNSTPAMSAAMAGIAPNGKVEIIADAAHMMPMTHRGQVNAHLLNFFAGCRT